MARTKDMFQSHAYLTCGISDASHGHINTNKNINTYNWVVLLSIFMLKKIIKTLYIGFITSTPF